MNTSKSNPEPAATEKTGRDAQGRFATGNPGGPGNPFGRRVAELRKVMLECVTDSEMRIVVGELMVQAKCGNLTAIKLLFQYVVGKPAATVDPDAVDVAEVELWQRAPRMEAVGEIVSGRMHAATAARMLNVTVPTLGEAQCQAYRDALVDPEAFYQECDRIDTLEDQEGDATADRDDEEAADDDADDSVTAVVGTPVEPRRAAPSTNGGTQGNGRPRATPPSPNGRTAGGKRQTGGLQNGDDRRRSSGERGPDRQPPRRM
jgi:hypothetical protein